MTLRKWTALLPMLGLAALWIVFSMFSGGPGTRAPDPGPDSGPRIASDSPSVPARIPRREERPDAPVESETASNARVRSSGSIGGRVRTLSGEGLEGVRVVARDTSGSLRDVAAVTGDHGAFALERPPGEYRLLVDPKSLPDGYLPPFRQERSGRAHKQGLGSTTVRVREGAEVRAELTVVRAARATGQVLGVGGEPVVSAAVRLQSMGMGEPAALCADAVTDRHGYYTFDDVYQGRYRLEVFLSVSEGHAGLPNPIPLEVDIFEGGTFSLPTVWVGMDQRSIRGRVVDDRGEPFPGILVGAYFLQSHTQYNRPARTFLSHAVTDESGEYVLEGLPAAPVRLYVPDDWEPKVPLVERRAAFFAEPVDVDLTRGSGEAVVPDVRLDRSRPFTLRCRVSATGSRVVGLMPEVTVTARVSPSWVRPGDWPRRPSPNVGPVPFDPETGMFTWQVETPHPPVILRFEAARGDFAPVEVMIEPEPDRSEMREVFLHGR